MKNTWDDVFGAFFFKNLFSLWNIIYESMPFQTFYHSGKNERNRTSNKWDDVFGAFFFKNLFSLWNIIYESMPFQTFCHSGKNERNRTSNKQK